MVYVSHPLFSMRDFRLTHCFPTRFSDRPVYNAYAKEYSFFYCNQSSFSSPVLSLSSKCTDSQTSEFRHVFPFCRIPYRILHLHVHRNPFFRFGRSHKLDQSVREWFDRSWSVLYPFYCRMGVGRIGEFMDVQECESTLPIYKVETVLMWVLESFTGMGAFTW